MPSRLLVGALVGLLVLPGCGHGRRTKKTDGGNDHVATTDVRTPLRDPSRRAGAAHTASIDLVALSLDGTAAITRDQIGSVRVWPKLDGSLEPVVIPVQGAATLAVEPRGSAGHTVVVVEPSGAAKVFAVDAAGEVEETGALPPFAPLFGAWILPGGERVLALYKDHSIRMLDRNAKELARLDERRFRPTELALSADGRTFVAVTRESGKVTLQRGTIRADAQPPVIERVTASREIKPSGVASTGGTLSPDATRWAWVDRVVGNAWEIAVVDLGQATGETRFTVQVPPHLVPNIGFASDRGLLVSANDGSLSWLIDPQSGAMRPRSAAPQDFATQGRAQAVAANIQVAGHGTFLFVHDVKARTHRFLGYRSFQAQSAAISPDGRYVAWAPVTGPVLVEPLAGDEPPVEIVGDESFSTFRVRFVDSDRLLLIDAAGGVRLFAWRTQAVLDHVGVNGGLRAVHFDDDRGILIIERHNNDAAVYRVGKKGFTGPWMIADSSFRTGLLGDTDAKSEDKPIVWTLDSSNRLRRYSLADLRADLTRDQIEAMGTPLEAGKVAPLAIDRFGRHYGVRWNGSAMELFVDFGKHSKTAPSPSGDITQIIPSGDGQRFIAVHQRGQSTSLVMHDVETLQERWSYASGIFHNEVTWSPDGRYVTVAANSGAALLDAASGEPVVRRCGIEFRAVGSAPANAFHAVNLRSLCEP